ncbi:hypothetical protein UA08_05514 [Talaromyces atroroseus]|uniref:Aminoglycoside phosphotransferase domain-containing protein n=1 Tax=Talaromyces atroroseus TaxID=1441469 RepID=A0A225AIT3_TALAT|nr:hypothetical protein UA08_05514 [Talaromyces atroroseus]OKL59253.1 hypothetical protein UA08_05514 [Talaromyces atroroseus]
MGNIFISEHDPEVVTGIIDWQNTSINPLFLQARWPVFLTPPEGYQLGQVMPQLPADYDSRDEDDKEIALYSKAKATWKKAYEVASFLNNRETWRAMQVVPELKEDFTLYEEWHQMRKFTKEMLDTDDEGWIAPERDLEETKSRNKMLLEHYVTQARRLPEEVENMWPFPLDT